MQEQNPISITCPNCKSAPEVKCTFKVRDGSKFMDAFHPERIARISRIHMTLEQEAAVMNKWKQSQQDMSLDAFLNSVQPTIGCDGAVTVKWSGMWLCIEKDGYTHS